jgi:hypothetical protein
MTLYRRRLKSHVLIGLIRGSFIDHKSGLHGGETRSVQTVCYGISVLLLISSVLYVSSLYTLFLPASVKKNVCGFRLLKNHS